MTDATTERAEYRFRVKEFVDGTPYIVLEPLRGDLALLKENDAMVGFDLREGVTYKEAQKIAEYLNHNLTTMLCTRFFEKASDAIH